MANSILDILIRTITSGDKKPGEVAKSLINLKQTIGTAGAAFAAFAGATYVVDKALDATVGRYVEYGQRVRDTKTALGLSADETSRVIALTDDLGISYEDLSKSIKANADSTNFSIEGLAAASAEYLALGNAQDRAKFAQDNYGKSWAQVAKLLEKGPDQVREMAASIDDAHLFDDADLKRIEDYRMKTDQLNDTWEGFVMTMGEKVVPILNAVMTGESDGEKAFKAYAESIGMTGPQLDALGHSMRQFNADAERGAAMTRFYTDELIETGETAEELLARNEALMASNKELLDTTFNLQEGYDRFSEKNLELVAAQDELMAQKEVLLQDLDELRSQGFWETGKTITKVKDDIAELDEKLAENGAEFDANAKAAEEWSKKLVFSMIQARLAASGGGVDADEFAFLIGLGENMGLIDEKTATMAQNLNDSLNDIDLSKPQDFEQLWRDILELPREATFTITTNTNGSPTEPSHPGGGGFATGGAFDAGSPMLVHKDEILVPDYGGVVLTRTDAMKLMQGNNGGNGGGKTFINYGSFTVVVQGGVMDVLDELS